MTKRPFCLIFAGLVILILLIHLLGISWIWKSPGGKHPFDLAEESSTVRISGKVREADRIEGTYTSSVYLILTSVQLFNESQSYSLRNVKCYLTEDQLLEFGTHVVLEGVLSRPAQASNPGEFDQRTYEQSRKIDFYLEKAILISKIPENNHFYIWREALRESCRVQLEHLFPETEAGVLKAMLLGDKSDMDDGIREGYQAAGISHILAISGLHISVLGMGLFSLLVALSVPLSLSFGIPLSILLCYGIFLDSPLTVFRAVAMFAVLAGSRMLGRSYDLLSAWAVAGILLVVDNPDVVFDSGFQLSFGAVVGIVYTQAVMGTATEMVEKRRGVGRSLWKKFMEGFHLWIFLLPIVLHAYYQVSVAGLICNLIVIPLLPAVLISGLAGLMISFFSLFGGSLLGTAAYGILRCCEWLGRLADHAPLAVWTPGQPRFWQIVVYYLLLLGGFGIGFRISPKIEFKTGLEMGFKKLQALFHYGNIGFLVLFLTTSFEPHTKVTMLDVGQGDGIILQSHSTQFLVDGGSSSRGHVGSRVLIPFLKQQGIAHLEGVILTHTDEDHTNGVEELLEEAKRGWLTIDTLYLPCWMVVDEKSEALLRVAKEADIRVETLKQGDCLRAVSMELHVLYPSGDLRPEDPNDGSVALYWRTDSLSGLLTGDLPAEGERAITEMFRQEEYFVGNCDFLKVGHHGSGTSSCEEFLTWIQPKTALISCGYHNRYGHPATEVLERLETIDCQILRTDLMGAVSLCE